MIAFYPGLSQIKRLKAAKALQMRLRIVYRSSQLSLEPVCEAVVSPDRRRA